MRSRIVAAFLLASTVAALAADFEVGDRVHIGLNGKDGTVVGLNGTLGNGAASLRVHVDGAAYPENVGIVYDSITAQVTKTGHIAPPAPPSAPANPPQLPTPNFAAARPAPNPMATPTPQNATASIQAGASRMYQPGDRLHIIRSNRDCTVLEVQQRLFNGGYMLKVHEDGAGYAPNQGVVIDTGVNPVTFISHGAPPAALVAPAPIGAIVANNQHPGKAPVTPANCQQAIRASYPAGGADQIINVKFLDFQSSGMGPYVQRYQGGFTNGPGHNVQAMTIHARYQVLTRFASPNADDQLRTYDAHFKCYNSAVGGELTAEMTDRLPGGEHAEYIKKR